MDGLDESAVHLELEQAFCGGIERKCEGELTIGANKIGWKEWMTDFLGHS